MEQLKQESEITANDEEEITANDEEEITANDEEDQTDVEQFIVFDKEACLIRGTVRAEYSINHNGYNDYKKIIKGNVTFHNFVLWEYQILGGFDPKSQSVHVEFYIPELHDYFTIDPFSSPFEAMKILQPCIYTDSHYDFYVSFQISIIDGACTFIVPYRSKTRPSDNEITRVNNILVPPEYLGRIFEMKNASFWKRCRSKSYYPSTVIFEPTDLPRS